MKLFKTFHKISILAILVFILINCEKETTKNLVWEEFKNRIETNDYEYLISNSFDSIKCINCIPNKGENLYLNENIFKNHRVNFYNPKLLKDKKYSVFQNNSMIRINYSFENKFGEESYNIIYMFDKNKDSFILSGKIIVP